MKITDKMWFEEGCQVSVQKHTGEVLFFYYVSHDEHNIYGKRQVVENSADKMNFVEALVAVDLESIIEIQVYK